MPGPSPFDGRGAGKPAGHAVDTVPGSISRRTGAGRDRTHPGRSPQPRACRLSQPKSLLARPRRFRTPPALQPCLRCPRGAEPVRTDQGESSSEPARTLIRRSSRRHRHRHHRGVLGRVLPRARNGSAGVGPGTRWGGRTACVRRARMAHPRRARCGRGRREPRAAHLPGRSRRGRRRRRLRAGGALRRSST